jgi:hypothetical protein
MRLSAISKVFSRAFAALVEVAATAAGGGLRLGDS